MKRYFEVHLTIPSDLYYLAQSLGVDVHRFQNLMPDGSCRTEVVTEVRGDGGMDRALRVLDKHKSLFSSDLVLREKIELLPWNVVGAPLYHETHVKVVTDCLNLYSRRCGFVPSVNSTTKRMTATFRSVGYEFWEHDEHLVRRLDRLSRWVTILGYTTEAIVMDSHREMDKEWEGGLVLCK